MNRKTLSIVIALLVLSISALLVANPNILGGFSSTVNGVPVQVTISRQDNGTVTTMRTEDLLKNATNRYYGEQFVRFMGVVNSVDWRESKKVTLTLDNLDDDGDAHYIHLFVHPLDSPHLPMEYQVRHVYEFTGFLLNYDLRLLGPGSSSVRVVRVYAFEIRHHGSLSAAEQFAEDFAEDAESDD